MDDERAKNHRLKRCRTSSSSPPCSTWKELELCFTACDGLLWLLQRTKQLSMDVLLHEAAVACGHVDDFPSYILQCVCGDDVAGDMLSLERGKGELCNTVVVAATDGYGMHITKRLTATQLKARSNRVRKRINALLTKSNRTVDSLAMAVMPIVDEYDNETTRCSTTTTAAAAAAAAAMADCSPLQVSNFLTYIRSCPFYRKQDVYIVDLPVRTATTVDDFDMSKGVAAALREEFGIVNLYSHQTAAITAFRRGASVGLVTATSSGKSLAYHIPVLEWAIAHPNNVTALYLFPTKALAQDQMMSFTLLGSSRHLDVPVVCNPYDGDTPMDVREEVRRASQVVLSNPDMLHKTVLPQHRRWPKLFAHLRFVVIDEAHVYRGAFGCHVACTLRRLIRLCRYYDNTDVRFFFCSATIGNAEQHFRNLVPMNHELYIVPESMDGSPRGARQVVVWNPGLKQHQTNDTKELNEKIPLYIDENGDASNDIDGSSLRDSTVSDAAHILTEMVKHRITSIAFCKVRSVCELLLYQVHARLRQHGVDSLVDVVTSYRGGYLPENRRRIERELFLGRLRSVISTSALEVGIDVGALDASVHVGFPSSVSSLWQQIGRVGRGTRSATSIVLLFSSPLDQFVAQHAEDIIFKGSENAFLNPDNHVVMSQHLICAAYEVPLSRDLDAPLFGTDNFIKAVTSLVTASTMSKPLLRELPDSTGWVITGYVDFPVKTVSLRSIRGDPFRVLHSSLCLDVVDEKRAIFEVYPGSIWLFQGQQYEVVELDLERRVAQVTPSRHCYYTTVRDHTAVNVQRFLRASLIRITSSDDATNSNVLNEDGNTVTGQLPKGILSLADIHTSVFGFWKHFYVSSNPPEKHDLALPPIVFQTTAVWIAISPRVRVRFLSLAPLSSRNSRTRNSLSSAQHAASHLLRALVPLLVICDRSDIGVECISPYEVVERPERLLLYDTREGGIGLAEQILQSFGRLLIMAYEVISNCSCHHGCPSCVHDFHCSEQNEIIDKAACTLLLCCLLSEISDDPKNPWFISTTS